MSEPLCALQAGARWPTGDRDVAAIVCRGTPGIFVPSAEFRALDLMARDGLLAARALDLADQELRHRSAINLSLSNDLVSARVRADAWEALATKLAKDVDDASARGWWESDALWFVAGGVLGAGSIVAIVLAVRP